MGRRRNIILIVCVAIVVTCIFLFGVNREREVVILSTNDIHANIEEFPRLATAVAECRDTVATLLLDAGDRWTGNAYVDLAKGRRPILDLMNDLGYDAATLGNHEFDMGVAFLADAIEYAEFPIVCANLKSERADFPPLKGSVLLETTNGVRVLVTGVVTNYDNGHPDGKNELFEGLTFPDAAQSIRDAELRDAKSDVSVVLSHLGDTHDYELCGEESDVDVIIGGHTHMVVDTLIGKTIVGQTGSRLHNIGVTRLRLRGQKIVSAHYENIPLERYEEDSLFKARVQQICSNAELNAEVGTIAKPLDKCGLGAMQSTIARLSENADIGFYHYGGIRLYNLPSGGISRATLYNLEPFFSHIHTMNMTTEQIRDMIIRKFNDRGNVKESHRIDLFSTTPYTIIVDDSGDAVDVLFPYLRSKHTYKVAISDYAAGKYDFERSNEVRHDRTMMELMEEYLCSHDSAEFSNVPLQKIVRRK